MKINPEISPLQNLIALVLSANPGATLTEEQFVAGLPAVIVEPVDGINTNIEFKSVLGAGYSRAVTFGYKRLGLDEQVAEAPAEMTALHDCTQEDILTHLAAVLGLIETELQVDEYLAPTINEEDGTELTQGNIKISANEASLLYVGELNVVLRSFVQPAMDDVFTVTELEGFVPDMDAPSADADHPASHA